MSLTPCKVLDLGLIEYASAYRFQQELASHRRFGETSDTVLLAEHFPAVTVGQGAVFEPWSAAWKELEEHDGLEIHEVDRGGGLAVHAPGQLMVYPIFDLQKKHWHLAEYLNILQAVMLACLENFGIDGHVHGQWDGVYAYGKQLGQLGVSVRHHICYHGFSMNVDPDINYFDLPALEDELEVEVGAITEFATRPVTMALTKQQIIRSLRELCELDIIEQERVSLPV